MPIPGASSATQKQIREAQAAAHKRYQKQYKLGDSSRNSRADRDLLKKFQQESEAGLLQAFQADIQRQAQEAKERGSQLRRQEIQQRAERLQSIIEKQNAARLKRESARRGQLIANARRQAVSINKQLRDVATGGPGRKDNSLVARATRLAGDALNAVPAVKGALDLAAKPQEEISQIYHAAKNAQLSGANTWDQLGAGLLQIPGLGHLDDQGGDRTQRLFDYGREVNSREEREALRAAGEYASPGEFITGKAEDVLSGDALQAYRDYVQTPGIGGGRAPSIVENIASALTDAGFSIGTDPLTYLPGALGRAGANNPTRTAGTKAAEQAGKKVDDATRRAIAEAARDEFLTSTRRGRAIETEALRVATNAADVIDITKAMPGMPTTTAAEIAGASTKVEAQNILRRALRTGEYAPDISIRRQALLATTGRGLKAPAGLGLGRKVIREREGLFNVVGDMRNLATGNKGRVALTRTSSTAAARRGATKSALRHVGVRSGDARDLVARSSLGMTPFERIDAVLTDVSALDPLVADIVESTVEGLLPSGKMSAADRAAGDYASWVNGAFEGGKDADDALQALLEAETLIATARGDFGEEAAEQLRIELGVGYSRPGEASVQQTIRRAGNRAGLAPPKTRGFSKATKANFDTVAEEIDEVGDAHLQELLRGELGKVRSSSKNRAKQLSSLRKTVGLARRSDDVAADAAGLLARYGDAVDARPDLVGGGRRGLGQKLNLARQLGKVVTSLAETVAPNQIRFLSTENIELAVQGRVEALDSYMGALGMDDASRASLRQAVAEVGTEADLYEVVDRSLQILADAEGVPAEILSELLSKTKGDAKRMGFKVQTAEDGKAELVREVQNLSQLSETVPLPDPVDVKKTIRQLRKAMDDPEKLSEIQRYLAEPRELRKVANFLGGIHRTWKLMVVTNLYMPVVGGFAGFVGEDGDFTDRLKRGFQGAAVGALAPSRYVLRIGIEETARRTLVRTFSPSEFIPGYAKWNAERGVVKPLMSAHLLSSGDPTGSTWLRNELSTHATGEFDAMALPDSDGILTKLSRKDSRYIDSWHRIINHEINDANGAVDRIFLGLKAGHITKGEADELIKAFLKSPDGKTWYRRWKGAHGVPKSKKEALLRQQSFINDYVPADIARVRLPAMDADFQTVPKSLLKGAVKERRAPAFIHAENTWKIPRARTFFSDVGKVKDKLTDKLIFGGPTRTMQRRPLARALYKDEYMKLVRGGMEPERAAQLADQRAINVTNDVMFNQSNESRFSSKVDIVFPFQQPREELIRVWAPLVFNNKIRAVQMTKLGAQALENGASLGVFYEYTNPFTGEKDWRMKVPGSASLSRALGGVNAGFDFGLKDVMFMSQDSYQTLGIPSPGGPFFTVMSRGFVNAFPEHYANMPDLLREYLFPFGASGRLGRAEPNRLWMGLMGTPAPWEFANQFEQREEYKKVQQEIFLTLYWENFKKTGKREWPSDEEVDEAVDAYFQTQALIGAVWPARTRYMQPYEELLEAAKQPYLDANGELDYFGFINDHPTFAPFLSARNEYVGPDDLKHWSREEQEAADDYTLHWSKRYSLKEFRQRMKENALSAEAWAERTQIPFSHPDHELADAYIAWEEKWGEKHPEVLTSSQNSYFRDQQLHRIMQMADGPHKDRVLNIWRKKYNVSFTRYRYLVKDLEREGWEVDYWRFSRPTDLVVDDVKKRARLGGISEENAALGLNPAEQIKYWKHEQAELDYYDGTDDPQAVLDRYYALKNRVSDVYRKYPKLASTDKRKTPTEALIDSWRSKYGSDIDALYDEVRVVSARFDELKAAGKSWSAEGQALYEKRTAIYDLISGLKDKQFKELPGILDFVQDMEAATALLRDGKPTRAYMNAIRNLMSRGIGRGGFIPSNEELGVLNMPKEVRRAYVDDLMQQLDLPAVKGQKGKLYWEWLTDFQQDYLERNLPKDKIDEWKDVGPDDAAPRPGSGGGYRKWRYGGRGYYKGGSGDVELKFAYEMFKQYTKRPEGKKPPAAYAEYLKLPKNPAVRNQFLDAHPEVGEWISLGPMANMPAHMRYIVQNIMVKHGKWEGEVVSDQEINDLSFAREQLKVWNRRGTMLRPEAYDAWLQMPTGPEKAKFLAAHPEVERWLQLGPMANMPDAYQDVVRDIMVRYGEWTETSSALGDVIKGYYETPPYAREQYLEDHPELVDYWNAIRTPEQKKMAAKVDQYFSITDPTSRRAFLIIHPDVKDYFVQSRTERYEKFLTQVAIYMGQNPEMFDAYLERQEDILNDLMLRYASPSLVREVRRSTAPEVTERQRTRG